MGEPEKALDGTVGGALDQGGAKKDEASNEDQKPTREEQLRENDIENLVKEGQEAVAQINELNKESAVINAKKKEVRERMEAKGINRHALAGAVKVSNMSEDALDGYDLSNMILRKGIGKPIQTELFAVK